MTGRTMAILICGLALAVTAIPNNREPAAAAGDDVSYVTVADAPSDVTPAAEYDPLLTPEEVAAAVAEQSATVCGPSGCYVVRSGPVRSVVRSRTVYRTPVVYSAPVVYSQPVVYRSSYTYRAGVCQPVFMQRGPVRRTVAAAGRGVYRVATAPIRWLRCR